jgi:hypothetical protein
MLRILLACTACLVATSALAQPRPSSVAMTCAQAAGLVASRGAIVLGTGGYTYDRFVHHRGFCLITETTKPAWVPTRDTPQCFVGYTCVEADFWVDR